MLYLERERLEGAHGHSFLRSILDVSVTLSLMRNDHLRVSHDAESTRFQKGLLEPLASRVNIKSSLLVIDSVDYEGSFVPELVVVDVLSSRVDHVLSRV